MCFGSGPSAPQVIYQGPSQEDIDRQNAATEAYRQQAAEQQRLLTEQLQKQIDDANTAMAKQQAQLTAEQAAAASRAAQMQQGAYAVQTASVAPTATALQSTASTKEKANPRTKLKIAPGSTAADSGVGLNIGM